MSIIATTDVAINFVSFDDLGDGKGNVTVSFDGAEFTFATNRNDLDAEPSRPEYDRFIKIVVAGDAFDDDDDQNIEAAEKVAARGVTLASAYAEVCWARLDMN